MFWKNDKRLILNEIIFQNGWFYPAFPSAPALRFNSEAWVRRTVSLRGPAMTTRWDGFNNRTRRKLSPNPKDFVIPEGEADPESMPRKSRAEPAQNGAPLSSSREW
jgi:hypothetical protein